MSAKWTLASNTTIGDRLLDVGQCAKHLSDGSLVQLVHDPSVAAPNSVTLQVVPAPAHSTPSVIATINAVSTLGTGTFWLSGHPQSLALAVDAKDNIYVIGAYGGVTGGGIRVVYQAFIKGTGFMWTPQTANNCLGSLAGSPQLLGFAAVWCNTNGVAGHLAIVCNTNGTEEGFYSLSCSAILAGKAQNGSNVVTNPAFLGTGLAATAGSNIDICQLSFGAMSGFAVSSNSLTGLQIGAWGLSSSGLLTTGTGIVQTYTCGTLSATTKLRIRCLDGFNCTATYPSATTAGVLSTLSFNISGGSGGIVDTDNSSNFPSPGATLSWDVAAAAPSEATLWIYAWSSATPTTMLRMPVTIGGLSTPTLGAVVSDDTGVGSGAGNTTIRVVNDPVDFGHVDWQTYDVVSPYSLLGDFSALPTEPAAPVLISPANGSALGLASSGGVMSWNALVSELLGDSQQSFAFRRQVSGGAYEWWTGSTWQSTEIFITSATPSLTFASGHWTVNDTYQWWVSVTGLSGIASDYSDPFTVTVLAPPAAPTLTAAYDPVPDRTTLVVQGSVASAPVGSIEFSDDGGATWVFVLGATQLEIYPGPVTVYDYENSALVGREYRARNWSLIPLNYSGYVTASVGAAQRSSYSIKDPSTGVSVPVLMTQATRQDAIDELITVHRPGGRANPITVADAVIGPDGLATGNVTARDGQATFVTQNPTDQETLMDLLELQRELLIQSALDPPLWIRRLTNVASEVAVAGAPFVTYFENAVTWVTVDRPAP